ncbi:MAG: lipopolysaccharide kinase InaA family protein, partial [Verrucomicrobiota bacterium]
VENSQLSRSRPLFRQFLAAMNPPWNRNGIRGVWLPEPGENIEKLHETAKLAEKSPSSTLIKTSARSRIVRAEIGGMDVIIKRFIHDTPSRRWKYLCRVSQGRRACAAARTLLEVGLPTPDPCGFFEVRRNGLPVESYLLTRRIEGADEARKWLRPYFHRQPEDLRQQIRTELLELLLNLYRNGIYHSDTKSRNMLLRAPVDSANRAWFWIDLEGMKFGVRPNRHMITRNLVQLNGSLGSKISDEDRLAFLHDMAKTYPWLAEPNVEEDIRAWTLQRLERELRREERP